MRRTKNKTVLLDEANRGKGITITTGNFSGGSGKTQNTALIAYTMAKRGIKTLVIDLDPQANLTKQLLLTKKNRDENADLSIRKTVMMAVSDGSFEDAPVQIMDNLDLLAGYIDFEDFPRWAIRHHENEDDVLFVIKRMLEPLKARYDVIIFDTPPSGREITSNAIVASDYVFITVQTADKSLSGAENYAQKLLALDTKYNLNLLILGFIMVILKKGTKVDQTIVANAEKSFGADNIFENMVNYMERVKSFEMIGISEDGWWDRLVTDRYEEITDEFLTRLNAFEHAKREVLNNE